MKTKHYIHVLIGLFLSMAYSCIEDKTVLADREIGDIQIEGVNKHYSIKALGELSVEPVVYSDDPEDEFRYEWYLFDVIQDNVLTQEEIDSYRIGDGPVLNYPVKVKSGNYRLLLKAYSKKTGLMAHVEASVGVAETNGFFVLKETENGDTDVDLFALSDDNRSGQLFADRFRSLKGQSLSGKPRHMDVIYNQSYLNLDSLKVDKEKINIDHTFFITTENNDTHFIRYSDFEDVMSEQNMFYNYPASFTPYRVVSVDWYCYMLTKEGMYYTMLGNPVYVDPGCFSDAILDASAGSEHVVTTPGRTHILYWDNETSSVRAYNLLTYSSSEVVSDKAGFATENLPYEPLFVGITEQAEKEYNVMLMREKNKSATYMYFITLSYRSSTCPVDSVAVFDSNSLLNRATEFAINSGVSINRAPFLYFVADNKLYVHSLANAKEDEEVHMDGFGKGETITYVSNPYWKNQKNPEKDFNYLIIGTQQGTACKVYFYNMIGGKPYGNPVYTIVGTGKLKQVQFVSSIYDKKDIRYSLLDH